MLRNDHSIIPHLTHHLIQFASESQFNKEMINTSNALHSIAALTCYKLNIHFNYEQDQQTFEVRRSSRECLWSIHEFGDVSAQTELVNARYARVYAISICTANGAGEEQDGEICNGLNHIFKFIRDLHQGKYISWLPQFPPQPLLARRSVEQIEEEGANEEVDAQLIKNKENRGNIKGQANKVKGKILNYFINKGNLRPSWYNN
ncbi:MAG: hypothetical protein EZS28_022709 [Streblomastix strix]|uniref:Uncharacterized protein n=1 Tax=Streblomastix strix TaxID=222440 RepID=A0A5J4VH56_9EUKA|nr:MAG: hypothetical protein EZS28_022709 [Streblomastix strix]